MDSEWRLTFIEYLYDWPLYVTDDDRVSCYQEGCEDPEFLHWPRRKSFGEFANELAKHIREYHNGGKFAQTPPLPGTLQYWVAAEKRGQ